MHRVRWMERRGGGTKNSSSSRRRGERGGGGEEVLLLQLVKLEKGRLEGPPPFSSLWEGKEMVEEGGLSNSFQRGGRRRKRGVTKQRAKQVKEERARRGKAPLFQSCQIFSPKKKPRFFCELLHALALEYLSSTNFAAVLETKKKESDLVPFSSNHLAALFFLLHALRCCERERESERSDCWPSSSFLLSLPPSFFSPLPACVRVLVLLSSPPPPSSSFLPSESLRNCSPSLPPTAPRKEGRKEGRMGKEKPSSSSFPPSFLRMCTGRVRREWRRQISRIDGCYYCTVLVV